MKHQKLILAERIRISIWLDEGKSKRECARLLGRNHSTVVREVERNSIGNVYEPLRANDKALKRRERAWMAKHPLKSSKVFSYVIDKLRDGWSPEQISGRLKEVDHVGDTTWHICHETIYAFIYSVKRKDKIYWEYLRRKQKRRRKRNGKKSQRVRIPDRVSIHNRPKEVDKRRVPGHWEGDSVVGRGHINGLHTEYERVTSMTRFERLKRVDSEETLLAMKKVFDPLPDHLKKSTTLDNGSEMVKHNKVGIPTFFADPYASWQRGGNENANMWIRYYFPKGTDFSTVSDTELKDVEREINNRPRKRLGYRTPQEVFNSFLVQS